MNVRMIQIVARLFHEAVELSAEDRAELADRLVATLDDEIPAGIEACQLAEVRRRIAGLERGDLVTIGGHEALAQVRWKVKSLRESK